MTFHLASVTKPMPSEDALVGKGHTAVFAPASAGGSYLELSNGKRVALKHEGRAFVLDVAVGFPLEQVLLGAARDAAYDPLDDRDVPQEMRATSQWTRQRAHTHARERRRDDVICL